MVANASTHSYFLESLAVGDVIFQFSKVSIELGNTAGLKNSDNVLEVVIWKKIFFVIMNGYHGLGDAGQQASDFIDVFSFVVVLDAVVEDCANKCSFIGIIGENKVLKEKLEEQGLSLLKGFKGCKLALDYLIELGFKVVAEVAVGPFQLIVEGSLGGSCNSIHSGGNEVSDIESKAPAGGCNLFAISCL